MVEASRTRIEPLIGAAAARYSVKYWKLEGLSREKVTGWVNNYSHRVSMVLMLKKPIAAIAYISMIVGII